MMRMKGFLVFLMAALALAGCGFPTPRPTPPVDNTQATLDALANATAVPLPPTGAALEPTGTPAVIVMTNTPEGSLPSPQPATPAPSAVGYTVTEQVIQEDQENPPYTIDVKYPQFTDAAGNPVQALNDAVLDVVNRNYQPFRDVAVAATPMPEVTSKNGLTMTYEVKQNDGRFVSVFFLISTYFQGAAHPLPYSETVNYSTAAGRTLWLEELFRPGVDGRALLSERSQADLTAQGRLESPEGVSPAAENFKSWNITPAGLELTFDPYQVAAYAAGFQKVLLPWSTLADVLNPELGLP